ncbi:MAG: transcription-repair coupling factor [Elusimicrobiota bacterium]
MNPLELSGALAYSVVKSNYIYKNMIIQMKTDENAVDIADDILTVSTILKQPIPEIIILPENDISLRIKALSQILADKKFCLCTTVGAVHKKTFSIGNFKKSILKIKKNDIINRNLLISQITENGYERVEIVTETGEFAVRGEIIDIWQITSNLPVRFVFNINTVESIKNFDAASQRSISEINEVEILPAKEKAETSIFKQMPKNKFRTLGEKDIVPYLPVSEFNGDIEVFKHQYKQWQNDDFHVFIVANNTGEKQHLAELLGKQYENSIFTGSLSSGFVVDADRIVFITTNELFSRYKLKIRPPKFFKKLGEPIETLSDIKPGDFVVHEKYGIGIYDGLKTLTAGGFTAEYISILYADNDKLFVSITDFHRIQKYFSISNKLPKINSLDSTIWERTKAVADENARKLAQQLLQVYAERLDLKREPFIADSEYEKKFEAEFVYTETPDQQKVIEDIKNDMVSPSPMERCVFGDTGFGKTEVAMRASLKSVLSGRQVCLIAPTTVLVQQHEQTFSDRFADWPVKIETLSRFKTKNQQKTIVRNISDGRIDIIIGTHRLLSNDVKFNNLGLLIIDDEHRFGVADKEKIKSLKKNVDVLYLTATPIPRTLSLALSGIKNMSTIETPPAGRQEVETTLLEYNEKTIANALMYEISRGGQVFYIHNRIETIESCLNHFKRQLPLVRFDFIHGKMSSKEIESKMLKFLQKEFDCLISTTIIEAGLDIPNVNTIIVEDTHRFGLGQLYQLRGRVGRSKIKAYCYLFYRKDCLTEDADKRLSAITDFTKLGSGFRLALKDLQIRGAGELLGKRQHGYIDSIGFDMYLRLLEKHSNEIKGLPTKEEPNPEIDIFVDAVIPKTYIDNELQRIGFYKRILTASAPKELNELAIELADRFGKMPVEVENLLEIGSIRLVAKQLKILKIATTSSTTTESILIKFSIDTSVEPSKIIAVLKNNKLNFKFGQTDLIEIFFKGGKGGNKDYSQKEKIIFVKKLLQSFQ